MIVLNFCAPEAGRTMITRLPSRADLMAPTCLCTISRTVASSASPRGLALSTSARIAVAWLGVTTGAYTSL